MYSDTRYRWAAVGHLWEFTRLGLERREAVDALRETIAGDPDGVQEWLRANASVVMALVETVPSRRPAMLRRCTADSLGQIAMILGGWQHCRKAVIAYDWIAEHPGHFEAGQSYRAATVSQGIFFDELRERNWTRWPVQWERSPFKGERRRDRSDAPDYDEAMDEQGGYPYF
ncbi:hypothetical protein [Cupriavidus pampae]|uniref:HEAT repeat domain-containing protein n=1 Tax=Cupriavidus pampae TaxID=659251 RepID=A0ABM8XUD5_9BURK|nr:hypothetical protein [Cupriavidus pampae]CAG9183970.1 hypothetical protein LMG32289_05475 [Cupriavidus pampae]